MKCPKCGSENVTVSVINEVKLKDKHKSIFYYLLIWWWWAPIKWIFFTLPALLFAIFGHKKQKAVNIRKTVCCCQNCGHSWNK